MIRTKTIIPQRRPNMLHRPRLADRVQQHVDKALTLVFAPAGYGKTALLVDACHDAPFPVCWLSLDESDCDLYTFVDYFVATLQHHFPDFGELTRRALDANPALGRNPAALGSVIAQDMSNNISEFFVLILDDYHVVDKSLRVGELLEVILKHVDRWHLIVASRTAPVGLPVILLTAQERIAFIGQDDLAFTADEIRQMLEKTHSLDLTPEQAEELVAVSEGWITGIVLAMTSMWQGIRDALARARAQEGPIYAYLASQVFDEQPPALRETLLTMSTLPEMSDLLCRQVLGMSGAENVLQELERHGLFLTTVVDETGARHYRYHHLFRDFLQARLREQDPARFCQLHRQAAEWFEAQEEWEHAVAHRLAAGDARATAQTMDAGVMTMFYTGRVETLMTWYEAIPESLRTEFPRLLLFAARVLVDLGRVDETIPLLRQAETTFKERSETKLALATVLQRAAVRCIQGRYGETMDIAREALESSNLPDLSAEAHRLIGIACLNLGRPGKAVEHLRMALDLYQELGASETAVTYLDLSVAHLRLGQLAEGWACQDKAIEIYRSADSPGWQLAMTLNDIAYTRYYLAGDYVQALTSLQEALDVSREVGSPRAQAFALLSIADLYRDLGALKKAGELNRQAEEIARRSSHADLANFALMGIAQTLLQTGDVIEALGLAVQARDQAERRGDVYQLGLSCLTLGAARLEAGDPQTALAEIERGRDQLEQSGARRDLTRAYMLLARAHQVAGDVEDALKALSRALDVGVETQTFHYLIVEGQYVFDLLRRLLEQHPADRRLVQLMDRIRALPGIARETLGESTPPTALSRRSTLRFYGFGMGHVEKDGKITVWSSSTKARYLIFYLLTHSPRSRNQITATFWPDANGDKVSVFHWTKSQVQVVLDRQLIVYKNSLYGVAWDPDCWFDVNAFESLLDERGEGRRARLEEAVSLYRGDFLEGYDAEWCLFIRERLRLRYRGVLLELGELYMETEELANAFSVLNRAVAVDDLHGPAIRALMRFYVLDGRPRAATDLFHRLRQRLQELDASPEQETQSLYQSIQIGSSSASKIARTSLRTP